MTKSALRKVYLEKQRAVSARERAQKSRRISDRFFAAFDLKTVRALHVFLAVEENGEVETRFVYRRLWREYPKIETVTARVCFQTMTLEHRRFDRATALAPNRWRIAEPTGGDAVAAETIDVCLVPLLCFDRNGFRAGYGKGFYDRFLIECRPDCLKIGLSFFAPVEEIADRKNFDVKLDFCLTPETIWKF